MPAPSHESTKM